MRERSAKEYDIHLSTSFEVQSCALASGAVLGVYSFDF